MDTELPQTPVSLLFAVRCGSLSAWHRLVQLYAPLLAYWCKKNLLDDEDAEQVGSEVLLDIYRNPEAPDLSPPNFLDALRSRCEQACIRIVGQTTLTPKSTGPDRPETPGDSLPRDQVELQILCAQALSMLQPELPEDERIIFRKTVLTGQACSDLAAEQQVSVIDVLLKKSRTLTRLHTEFGDVIPFNMALS